MEQTTFVILAVIGSSLASSLVCPQGWSFYAREQTCLKYFPDRETFYNARDICSVQCSSLVQIRDDAKTDFIYNYLSTNGPIYIGVRSVDRGGVFKYVNGSELTDYRPWGTGQPDNESGGEFCVQLLGDNDRKWYDVRCTSSLAFVCEKNATEGNDYVDLDGTSGVITSPNYPNNYGRMEDKSWHFSVQNGYYIRCTFSPSLYLESMTTYDHLRIFEEQSCRIKQMTKNYTGQSLPQLYETASNKTEMKFTTDGSQVRSGFKVMWQIVKCPEDDMPLNSLLPCSTNLPGGDDSTCGDEGVITIPDYPYSYKEIIDIIWEIAVPRDSRIKITFHPSFGLDKMHGNLKLYETNSCGVKEMRKMFTGQIARADYISLSNKVQLQFHGFGSDVGFKLTWKKIQKPCGGIMYSPTGTITSPHYPGNYDDNSDCSWEIFMLSGYTIRLTFHPPFDIQKDSDYIRIFEMEEMSEVEKRAYTEQEVPLIFFTSKTNRVKITFTSDNNTVGQGFNITWERVGCPEGWSYYEAGQNCLKYFSEKKSFHQARDTCIHQDSDLVQIRDNYKRDFIYYDMNKDGPIYIGVHSVNSDGIFLYVDGSELTSYKPWAFSKADNTSNNNYCVHICQKTKGEWSKSRCDNVLPFVCEKHSGFISPEEAKENVINVGCKPKEKHFIFYIDEARNGSSGVIMSPNYPQNYEDNSNITWVISVHNGNFLKLTFQQPFELAKGNDTVKIYERITNGDRQERSVYTGDSLPSVYTSMTNLVEMIFTSDGSHNGKGFKVNWEKTEERCGGIFYNQTASLTSPHYPYNYDDSSDCAWVIVMPPGYSIRLTFSPPFILKENVEYLKIFETSTSGFRVEKRVYSGDIVPPVYTSVSNQVEITLRCNQSAIRKIFLVTWEKVGCSENWTFYEKDGKCLKFVSDKKSFHQARETCIQQDSDLVQIRGESKRDFIYYDMNKDGPVYIGVHSVSGDGIFTYVDGSDLSSYKPWKSNPQENTDNKPCVCLKDKASGGWKRIGCDITLSFVCEKDAESSDVQSKEDVNDNTNQNNNVIHYIGDAHNMSSGLIKYPQDTDGNKGPDNVTWIISVQNGKFIRFTYAEPFDLDPSKDYLKIYETLAKGMRRENNIFRCGGIFFSPSGFVTSPSYPNNYEDTSDCVWIIVVSDGYSIKLTFHPPFQLKDSSDRLGIYETNSIGVREERKVYSGNLVPPVYVSQTNQVEITFTSDHRGVKQEFNMTWERVGCPKSWSYYKAEEICLKYFLKKNTFYQARETCIQEESDLVQIYDDAKRDFIYYHMNKDGPMYIGVHSLNGGGIFKYVNGSELTSYKPWARNQADNPKGNEICVHLKDKVIKGWEENDCDETMAFVCERIAEHNDVLGNLQIDARDVSKEDKNNLSRTSLIYIIGGVIIFVCFVLGVGVGVNIARCKSKAGSTKSGVQNSRPQDNEEHTFTEMASMHLGTSSPRRITIDDHPTNFESLKVTDRHDQQLVF